MEKSNILCFLFILISLLLITNLLIFFRELPQKSHFSRQAVMAFTGLFSLISLVVSLIYERALRFLLLFWNSILAAIIGASSLYVFLNSLPIAKVFALMMLAYSIIVMLFMNKIANIRRKKHFSQTA